MTISLKGEVSNIYVDTVYIWQTQPYYYSGVQSLRYEGAEHNLAKVDYHR
jgi:hypothetical protein